MLGFAASSCRSLVMSRARPAAETVPSSALHRSIMITTRVCATKNHARQHIGMGTVLSPVSFLCWGANLSPAADAEFTFVDS